MARECARKTAWRMTGSAHRLKESRDGRRILPLNYLYSEVVRREAPEVLYKKLCVMEKLFLLRYKMQQI